MKTSLLFIWISFFIGNPGSAGEALDDAETQQNLNAESSTKYDRLSKEVDEFLSSYDSSQTNLSLTQQKTEAAKAELDAFQAEIKHKKSTSKNLVRARRKVNKLDREEKKEIADLRYSDEEQEADRKKIEKLTFDYDSAKTNSGYAAGIFNTNDRKFEKEVNHFKKTEQELQTYLARKYESAKLKNIDIHADLEPASLKNTLAKSARNLKEARLRTATSVQASTAQTAVTPLLIVAPPPTSAPTVVSRLNANPASASLSQCDQAQVKLSQLLIGSNPKILSDMVNLAALKMAYHMEEKNGGNIKRDSLEHYSTHIVQQMNASPDFQKKLSELYDANGRAADEVKNSRLSKGKLDYQDQSLRLDNDSASSVLLYLSQQNSYADFPFTEADAAAVWAQGELSSAAAQNGDGANANHFRVGTKEGNLLNFSTQVYGLLDQKAHSKMYRPTLNKLKQKLDDQQSLVQHAIEDQVKLMGKDMECFTAKTCASNPLKLGATDIATIQKNLAQTLSKSAQNTQRAPASEALTLDLTQTTVSQGQILLKLKK